MKCIICGQKTARIINTQSASGKSITVACCNKCINKFAITRRVTP